MREIFTAAEPKRRLPHLDARPQRTTENFEDFQRRLNCSGHAHATDKKKLYNKKRNRIL